MSKAELVRLWQSILRQPASAVVSPANEIAIKEWNRLRESEWKDPPNEQS